MQILQGSSGEPTSAAPPQRAGGETPPPRTLPSYPPFPSGRIKAIQPPWLLMVAVATARWEEQGGPDSDWSQFPRQPVPPCLAVPSAFCRLPRGGGGVGLCRVFRDPSPQSLKPTQLLQRCPALDPPITRSSPSLGISCLLSPHMPNSG